MASAIKKSAEATRVTLRNARRDGNKEADRQQKASDLTEDECKKGKEEIQKLTADYEKKVTTIVDAKSKEILES